MESRYEKFINCEAIKVAHDELNSFFDGDGGLKVEYLIADLFSCQPIIRIPKTTILQDLLENKDDVIFHSLEKFFDSAEENPNLYSKNVFIFRYVTPEDSLQDFKKIIDEDYFYNFHRDYPTPLLNFNKNRRGRNVVDEIYRAMVTELMGDNMDYPHKYIKYFSKSNLFEVFNLLLFNGSGLGINCYSEYNIVANYLIRNVEIFKTFMVTFKNFEFFKIFINRLLELITHNNYQFFTFDMGKFCGLSDPELPFEWNLELHLEECITIN